MQQEKKQAELLPDPGLHAAGSAGRAWTLFLGKIPENGSNPARTFCCEELTVATWARFPGNPEEEDGSDQRRRCLTWIGRMRRKSSWWGMEGKGLRPEGESHPCWHTADTSPFFFHLAQGSAEFQRCLGTAGVSCGCRGVRRESLKGLERHATLGILEPQLPHL